MLLIAGGMKILAEEEAIKVYFLEKQLTAAKTASGKDRKLEIMDR